MDFVLCGCSCMVPPKTGNYQGNYQVILFTGNYQVITRVQIRLPGKRAAILVQDRAGGSNKRDAERAVRAKSVGTVCYEGRSV